VLIAADLLQRLLVVLLGHALTRLPVLEAHRQYVVNTTEMKTSEITGTRRYIGGDETKL